MWLPSTKHRPKYGWGGVASRMIASEERADEHNHADKMGVHRTPRTPSTRSPSDDYRDGHHRADHPCHAEHEEPPRRQPRHHRADHFARGVVVRVAEFRAQMRTQAFRARGADTAPSTSAATVRLGVATASIARNAAARWSAASRKPGRASVIATADAIATRARKSSTAEADDGVGSGRVIAPPTPARRAR
jgi:hypothetical protein